ncbi:cell wall hydrolase [Sphingomonas qomolangmaensis]|uniref:Cell wall hydrolase n=1 Tax=Sphingomonas qomolangmaensis TaxID=2918765 RepID=A0ABY5L8B9_9SPHN|nr:cell wall hydrolase [Sphingomonas qomolangmaensis]UUL81944.1 cell wall hydrolase [Sphingomonas qomolangmaensis]
MKFFARAAGSVAVTLCAAAMVCATTPGLAVELANTEFLAVDRPDIQTKNVAYPAQVPIPPAPIVPAEWTSEGDQGPQTLADSTKSDARPDADYASLSDAVAAQGIPDSPDDELRCLAIGVYYESKGEPLAGQLAVAEVILNRADSGRFPPSACSVLKQRGQFSFVRGGRLPNVSTGSTAWKTAVAIAKVAREELWESKASNAMFFHARHVSPRWKLAKVASVGNHIFYR